MKERKILSLSGFKGVDLSSAPTMVQQNRASYSVNMINDNGINHKRPGWEEQLKFSVRINGIYYYVNGGKKVLVVYAGTNFYEVDIDTKSATRLTITGEHLELIDNRVQFFPKGDNLYIVGCGDFLVYRNDGTGATLKAVTEDSETYIPTTTVFGNVKKGVQLEPDENGEIKYDEAWVSYGNGAIIDSPSLITAQRRNKFVGIDPLPEHYGDGYAIYYTDAVFDETDFISVEIEQYVCGADGKQKLEVTKYTLDDLDGIISLCKNEGGKCYGVQSYYDWSGVDAEECNVTITFNAYYESEDRFSEVRKCRFGTVFGAFGNSDRLFLSGNPDIPNVDFYSLYDDFTQFTEGGRTAMGSDDVPITGYMRLSDSVLATLKADNSAEPTIYYRSAVERENSEGVTEVDFTRWTGGINEGCVNPQTVVNLAGDDIFVSPNGVYGVVQVQNTSKNDRYIRQRDLFINAELRDRDLTDALSFVYGNRYYLSLGNGECYVADPRYKNYLSEDIDGSYNYEWWKWTNVPARVFAGVEGELWFGDNDGRICRFDDKFCDRTHTETASGDVMHDSDAISFNTALDVRDGDIVKLVPQINVFRNHLSNAEVEDGWIKCPPEMINRVYVGQTVYADNVGASGLSSYAPYTVWEVDRGKCAFKIGWSITNEEYPEIKAGGFHLYLKINENERFYVVNVDKENGTFNISDGVSIVDLVRYGNTGDVDRLQFEHRRNVCSEWYTPVFDLGAPHFHKTLLRLNVTLDPNVRGSLKVGYETNDKLAYIGASAGKVFSFENFSFNDFSFTTGFTVTHSQKVKARNFNYITFRFVSDNDEDCAVDNFSAEYTCNGGRFAGMR